MIDREKVIHRLEIQLDDLQKYADNDQPLTLTQEQAQEIISLLKEQKHGETFIVIDNRTGEEADTYNIALHEGWAKHLCYCDMEGWAICEDGTLLLVDECGRFAYADRERFKVKWE